MQPVKKVSPAIAALIVIVLVGIVIATVVAINSSNSSKDSTTGSQGSSAQEATPTAPSSTSTDGSYKDGTYSSTGVYSTPGGQESIDLEVTMVNDVITATTLTQKAKSGEAKQYQAEFASGYKSLIVGKDIDKVSLSRVAGSSLTSNGFNAALEKIKTDADA